MRRDEGPSGSQSDREDMERMPRATGATGASSTGMQDTGSTSYQQPASRQTGGSTQGSYSQGTAPGRSADYGTAGYSRHAPSRAGAALAILAGALAFLEGLAFVIRSHFYPIEPGYAYRWTLHGWGWVLLVLGAVLFAGGVSSLLAIKGSRRFTAAVAIITAVVAFLTIFYSPIWSIVVVAACAFAAYNLLRDRGSDELYGADNTGYGARDQSYGNMSQGDQREQAMSQGRGSHRM